MITKSFISLEGVTVRLDGHVLFKNLNWEIRGDQHWAVIGPNGSGKSALMKVLAGILPAVKGHIEYHFLKDGEHESAHEQIAYVSFEEQRRVIGGEAYLQDRWNVGLSEKAPTVSDFLSERGIKHANPFFFQIPILSPKTKYRDLKFSTRRKEVIKKFGLESLLHRRIIELSNGERRKVTIARALLKRPRLLILDNPFEGLDSRFRSTLKKNLETLMEGDIRVIIVGTGREAMPRGVTHVLRIGEDRAITTGTWSGMIERKQKEVRLPQKTRSRTARAIIVRMKNVNVTYNKMPILRKLNWTVREGEKWALFGPNGAGKTTLLSLIMGDNPQAYANDITLFGKRRGTGESIWEIKKKIGWVSPELQLYYPADATCFDVVCSGFFDTIGLYRKCTAAQKKVAISWLKKFGLGRLAKTSFEDISEGEERLILLARALVKNPLLLILDEPCQGLDEKNRDRVLKAIDLACKDSSTTMIYVTHRTDELPKSITDVFKIARRAVQSSAR